MVSAETPTTWPDPDPMSTLEALLFFVGFPLGLALVIALLVMAPSVAKGPRYRPGLPWWADPEWFGAPVEGKSRAAIGPGGQQPQGATALSQVALSDDSLSEGGASARW